MMRRVAAVAAGASGGGRPLSIRINWLANNAQVYILAPRLGVASTHSLSYCNIRLEKSVYISTRIARNERRWLSTSSSISRPTGASGEPNHDNEKLSGADQVRMAPKVFPRPVPSSATASSTVPHPPSHQLQHPQRWNTATTFPQQLTEVSLHDVISVIAKTAEGQLSPANCANGFYALGKLLGKSRRQEPTYETKNLVKKLVTSASNKVFNRNQTLKIYYGVATGRLDLLDERLPRLLKTLIDVGIRQRSNSLQELSSQQITNLMMSLAKLGKPVSTSPPLGSLPTAADGSNGTRKLDHASLVRSLAKEICTRGLKEFNSRDISTMMWSLATLGDQDSEDERRVCTLVAAEICSRGLKDFTPQGISNLLWSFATLEYVHDDFLNAISQEILKQGLKSFNEQDISNLIWSLAKFGRRDEALCRMVLSEVYVRGLKNFNSQGITNLLSSFVKLGLSVSGSGKDSGDERNPTQFPDGTTLLKMVSQEIVQRGLKTFSNQAIASVAWSFGTAGSKDDRVFDVVAEEILHRGVRDLSSQHVSNLVLGFAKSGKSNDELFDAISQHVVHGSLRQFKDFTSQGISNLVWSFAKLERFDEELISCIVAEVLNRGMSDFSSQAISTTIWSIAKVGRYQNRDFLNLVLKEVKARGLKDFDAQDISNLLWSFATFGVRDEEFMAMVPDSIGQKLTESSFQSIVNIAWSLVCLDVLESPAGSRFFDLSLPKSIQVEYINEVALQLHQCKLAWMQAWPQQPLPRLLQGLIGDGRWIEQVVSDRNEKNESSSSHLEIAWVLGELGFIDLTNEYVTPSGVSVDILLPITNKHGAKVAIEVDGPFHFLSDGRTPTGATMFKRRLLEREGYKVYSINVMKEWRPLKTREDQRQYLRALLGSELLTAASGAGETTA